MDIFEGKKSLFTLRCYSGNCLEGLRKRARIFSHDKDFRLRLKKKQSTQTQHSVTMKLRAKSVSLFKNLHPST